MRAARALEREPEKARRTLEEALKGSSGVRRASGSRERREARWIQGADFAIRHRAKRFAATLSHAEQRKLYGLAPCLSRPVHSDAMSVRDCLRLTVSLLLP